jgi:glycosyltransferase involved in cell wall biosynthesis
VRIAYVTETWHPSVDGVVTRLEATLSELRDSGHQAMVVAPGGRNAKVEGVPIAGAPTVGVPFLAGGKPWGLPGPRSARALREFAPDIIHVLHPFVLGLAGVTAARRNRVPLVASFHQDIAAVAAYYHLGALSPLIWAYTRRLHARARATLTTSRATADTLTAHRIGPPRLWPYGVDLEFFHPRHRSEQARKRLTGGAGAEVVALYVGRLSPEKDLGRLAPLAAADETHLAVVGDGPLRPALERTLAGASVTFLGPLSGTALAEAFASSDVFVFPSTTETLGLVLLEALASGLPVVAIDTPTSTEILAGDTGSRLCPPGSPGSFPAVAHEVGTPGPERELRAAAARRAAQRWSWSAATAELLATYEAVIDTA